MLLLFVLLAFLATCWLAMTARRQAGPDLVPVCALPGVGIGVDASGLTSRSHCKLATPPPHRAIPTGLVRFRGENSTAARSRCLGTDDCEALGWTLMKLLMMGPRLAGGTFRFLVAASATWKRSPLAILMGHAAHSS